MRKKKAKAKELTNQLVFDFEQPLPKVASRQSVVRLERRLDPPRPPTTQSPLDHRLEERIHDRYQEYAKEAVGQLRIAVILAIAVIFVKGGVSLQEASFVFFKLDVSSKTVLAGLLGWLTVAFATLSVLYAVRARLLRREFPDQFVLSFERYKFEAFFVNALHALVLVFCSLLVVISIYFAWAEMLSFIIWIIGNLLPSPWQTEIVPAG
jgi:hypothetical protein